MKLYSIRILIGYGIWLQFHGTEYSHKLEGPIAQMQGYSLLNILPKVASRRIPS